MASLLFLILKIFLLLKLNKKEEESFLYWESQFHKAFVYPPHLIPFFVYNKKIVGLFPFILFNISVI